MNSNSNEIQQHVIKKQNMLPIIITSTTHVRSFVKGCHVQKHLWKLGVQERLMTKIEPNNLLEKYSVSTKKYDLIVGNLPFGKNVKFSNTFFCFLRSDRYVMSEVATAEKAGIFDEEGVLVR